MKTLATITACALAAVAVEMLAAYIWLIYGPWPEPHAF